ANPGGGAARAAWVALARPHRVDPFLTMRAAAWYGARAMHCPPQYYPGRDQIFRNAPREREELAELRRKARPKAHAATFKQAAEQGAGALRAVDDAFSRQISRLDPHAV